MNDKHATLPLTRRQVVALVGAMLAAPSATDAFSTLSPEQTPGPARRARGSGLPQNLRCEYRTNPLGVDVVFPRLSWTLTGTRRGERQTAYQVLAASTPQALAAGHGDLWDSGRVSTDQCSHVVYVGRRLVSRARCFWKVRVWDRNGQPTGWSDPAFWTIGLLRPADWQGKWISDAALADPANRPRTPIHCYRSEIAHTPNAVKWIVLDLGSPKTFDGACLMPAKPQGVNGDIATILYPVRFALEAAGSRDFHDGKVLVDRTDRDVSPPRPGLSNPEPYHFPRTTARYVRLAVSRLARWDGNDYALGLGRFLVLDGAEDIAAGAHVEASDSVETPEWSAKFLTDPNAVISYATIPAVLPPRMGGVDSLSRVPMLRREFVLGSAVRHATLYCSARGFYEARLNGQRVSDDLLAPGYTEYSNRLQYQAYDVGGLLRSGPNVLGILLGYGWYAGHMNINDNEYLYGYFPQFLAQLEIEYLDGRRQVVGSDAEWMSTLEGPVRWSDLLDGEGYDCRREMPGWDLPRFDAGTWKGVAVLPRDDTPIVWQRAQPVRRIDELQPVAVKQITPGVAVFDLGHEIAGWCRLKTDGPAGARLTLRYAEMRHADGSLNRDNLWGIPAQEDYRLDGQGLRVLEPHFTYHGFRFV